MSVSIINIMHKARKHREDRGLAEGSENRSSKEISREKRGRRGKQRGREREWEDPCSFNV